MFALAKCGGDEDDVDIITEKQYNNIQTKANDR